MVKRERRADQPPANRGEDAPGRRIRLSHRDNVMDKVEIDRVANGGFGEGE
jgi:hypothetical protein